MNRRRCIRVKVGACPGLFRHVVPVHIEKSETQPVLPAVEMTRFRQVFHDSYKVKHDVINGTTAG